MSLNDFDLHVHSNVSDGSLSPAELVELAARRRITLLSITDHDTVAGVAEGIGKGAELGVEVITGLEISIDFGPGTFHLLGYGIDTADDALLEALEFVQRARRDRNRIMVEQLNGLGLDISLDEVKAVAGPDQTGRPHFARVLVKKGYAADTQGAFDKYLAKGKPGYVDKKRMTIGDAVRVIRGAGGVPVLAHPVQLKLKSSSEYEKFIGHLREVGVLGIEAASNIDNHYEDGFFRSLADRVGCFVTGGSDFHGEVKPEIELGGFDRMTREDLEPFLERIGLKES